MRSALDQLANHEVETRVDGFVKLVDAGLDVNYLAKKILGMTDEDLAEMRAEAAKAMQADEEMYRNMNQYGLDGDTCCGDCNCG